MPAPPLARQTAAQLTTKAPSTAILGKRGSTRGTDGQWLAEYTDWQSWARRYARQIGAASFSASVIADCCARCDLRVEQRINGEWTPTEDRRFAGIMDEYSNPLQMTDDLIRLHAWHYQVAGEMLLTQRDGDFGRVDYGIYSTAAAEWDRPNPGDVMIKLVPDGKVDRDTAFIVPREQTVRLWIPDMEWMAYAWSPMAASIDDLKRWRALSRYVLRTADSALAMNGMLWAPGEAFEGPPIETDEVEQTDVGKPKNVMEEQYWQTAKMRHSESEDVTAVAPFLVHWDKELGAPVWVKMGEGLDPAGIEHRKEALEDFARSSNLPVTTVIGGGVGDANHWSEWLASDKFFDSGVAPTMNRMCHLDLTRAYLWPRARAAGMRDDQLGDIRIGYDPSPVIVKTDQSDIALQLNRAGLLSNEATLEAANFAETDAMPPGPQRDWLLEVLSGQKPPGAPPGGGVGPPGTVGPGNIKQIAPPRPTALPNNGRARAAGAGEREYIRDELGQFGVGGGGDEAGPQLEGKGTKDDPITGVASADEALRLIADGKYVEMDPDLVAVSLERMAQIANEAKQAGEKAPLYDLCNITSGDTSLFCGSSVVESRLDMPQLSGVPLPGSPAADMDRNDRGEVDITKGFLASLKSEGIRSRSAEVDPATLKASQNDLNGAKVAGMMTSMANGSMPPGSIMVSSDNYVIDGHHRWAANVGTDYTGGGQLTMPVVRIDMPIQQVLEKAKTYAKEQGLPQMQASVSRSRVAAVLAEALFAIAVEPDDDLVNA
jgi:hypothetical protein